jgi:hypothetical protein
VHISEKTADHLAAVGLRDLRLTLAKCTQVAERYFKIFKKKKVRMYKEVRDVGIQLWFHRKKGLEKIRARFAPLLE